MNFSKTLKVLYGLPVLWVFLLVAGPASGESLDETFLRGNIAYGNGDFTGAEAAYREVLTQVYSAEVHFNLGNALAQQARWSESAFHYMRAYSLNPNMDSARANLLLAANRMGLEKDYPEISMPGRLFSEKQWLAGAAIFFWLALILFFHGDFVRFRIPFHKTLGTVCTLVLIVSTAAIMQHKLFKEWAVVSSSLVSLRVAPTEQSPGESVLIKGDPVRIIGEQKGFFHVMTASGAEGFILREEAYSTGKD